MKQPQGFSQIELLVAVAIVAIVATAAVPNFLEAQTRSRVSQSQADLYRIANAIEAYTLDYGVIPLDGDDNNRNSIIPFRTTIAAETKRTTDIFPTCTPGEPNTTLIGRCYNFRTLMSWKMMTTPVAYLDKIYVDPYSEFVPYGHYDQVMNANPPAYCVLTSCGPDKTIANSTGRIGDVVPGSQEDRGGFGGRLIYGFEQIPDPLACALNNAYDPSNGTISYGEIYRVCAVKDLNQFYSWSRGNENGHGYGFPMATP